MAKKKGKPAPEPEPEPEPEPISDEEEVTCPVCGKPVGLEVTSCPNCGAEFEEEPEPEAEQPAIEEVEAEPEPEPEPAPAPAKVVPQIEEEVAEESIPVSEDETAECPVCGKSVSLKLNTCPNCGAEFEEEAVEEVIEVEEEAAPEEVIEEERIEVEAEEARPAKRPVAEEEVLVEEQEEISVVPELPTSIVDLRVIGVSLIILGIIGSQISAMIDWYWTWVPPIEDNLGMFIAIPAIVIVVGLAIFMLVRKALSGGKKVPLQMPQISLSLLLFGIFALIMIVLWNPINSALQSSQVGVAGAFIGIVIVGILAMVMGQRMTRRTASAS